jgi:nucleoside-diphosphate-sugar epimerase
MNELMRRELSETLAYHSPDFSGKNVLVTGGSGVIGNYLGSYMSNLPKSLRPSTVTLTSKSGVFPTTVDPMIRILKMDLTSLSEISKLGKYDSIFHAAGYGQPGKFLLEPIKTLSLNTWVTESLITKTNNLGDFIFFSSSEVYSGLDSTSLGENEIGSTNTDHPRAPYIEGKRTGEALTHIAGSSMSINAKSLRIALIYGPGAKSDDERVMYSFIRQALEKNEINLKDPGSAIRTYGYVLNAISQIVAVTKFGENGIYNIGGTSKTTILELAELIANITGARLNVPKVNTTYMLGAPTHVELNLKKVLSLDHQIPMIDLKVGLQRTIDCMKAK